MVKTKSMNVILWFLLLMLKGISPLGNSSFSKQGQKNKYKKKKKDNDYVHQKHIWLKGESFSPLIFCLKNETFHWRRGG